MENGLLILGFVFLFGFVGHILYKTTKIPESMFLIIIGILLGPVFNVINGSFFLENAAFFLNLALVVVLLNCGLSINITKIIKTTPLAFLFTVFVLIITTGIITFVTVFFFKWSLLNGIILGILGFGTEMITVSHLVERLNIGENTKTLLILESVLNDLLLIGLITVLVAISTKSAETSILRILLDKFFLSALLGITFAIVWLFLFIRYIHGNVLGYVFTLGACFFIFDIMDIFGFNGAIAVLIFSIALGNYKHFLKWFKNYHKFLPIEKDIVIVEDVNNQITFITRTLFFVFIGLVFNLKAISSQVFFFVFFISAVLILARYLSVLLLAKIKPEYVNSVPVITAMVASGFIDTLLAFVVIRAGVNIPNLTEIILLIVILTTFAAMISAILLEKFYHKKTY